MDTFNFLVIYRKMPVKLTRCNGVNFIPLVVETHDGWDAVYWTNLNSCLVFCVKLSG